MRFTLVDRIVQYESGAKITTVKVLSLGEEYLADHFPLFPVMPGVLMVEAMTQASAWLLRLTDDFAHSLITLKQANNLRFKNFVQPGQQLTVSATVLARSQGESQLDVQASVNGNSAVSGRLVLEERNLADVRPEWAAKDEYIKQHLRTLLSIIDRPDSPELARRSGTLLDAA